LTKIDGAFAWIFHVRAPPLWSCRLILRLHGLW